MSGDFGAEISVNTGSEGTVTGSKDTNDILKSILKTLQDSNKETSRSNKLQQSGLGGLGATIGKSLATALGIGTAAVSMSGVAEQVGNALGIDLKTDADKRSQNSYFENIITPEGEEYTVEIDKKSQQIVRIMTEKEAIEEGILTKAGAIKDKYDTNFSQWDKINKNSEKIGTRVLKSKEWIDGINTALKGRNENLLKIGSLESNELAIQRAINEAKSRLLAAVNKRINDSGTAKFFSNDTLTGAPYPGPLSDEFIQSKLSEAKDAASMDATNSFMDLQIRIKKENEIIVNSSKVNP